MTIRKRILNGRALLMATLIAVAGSCARPAWHPQNALLRDPDPEPITASDLKRFEEMLVDVAAGVGAVSASRGGASRRVCVLEERHTSVAGQLEAAVMLLRLHGRYGLRHIAVEGLTTDKPPPSTGWFRQLGDPEDEELRQELLVGFLREGEISAAELMALAFHDVVVHAADDPSDYAAELTPRAVGAPTRYLYKIGLKSISPEHYAHLRQFKRRHRVAEMVEYVISLDGWAQRRYDAIKREGGKTAVEQTLRELGEIEARAGSVSAEITDEERAAMSDARAFFEAAARRSATMVDVVRGLDDPSARMTVLNLGAAHTEAVSHLLGEAGETYAVLSPASLSEGEGRGDMSRESFERKGKALSVACTDKGLCSLLDGRKKPLPVIDRTWFRAAAQLRFATVLIARARFGPEFPRPELRRKINALNHVRVEWDSVRQVGSDKLFMAATLGERGWTDVWSYCGRPRAEIIRRGRRSLEELLVESLNAIRGESGRRPAPPRGPVFELVTQDVIAAYAREHVDIKEVMRAG